jgi:hypothetical protein
MCLFKTLFQQQRRSGNEYSDKEELKEIVYIQLILIDSALNTYSVG